eukprot:166054-Pyramimonas_sp.AAC.1
MRKARRRAALAAVEGGKAGSCRQRGSFEKRYLGYAARALPPRPRLAPSKKARSEFDKSPREV